MLYGTMFSQEEKRQIVESGEAEWFFGCLLAALAVAFIICSVRDGSFRIFLCRLVGHDWEETATQPECPLGYFWSWRHRYKCKRCREVKHSDVDMRESR